MKQKILSCLYIMILMTIFCGVVFWLYPIEMLRLFPVSNCKLVYKYYSVDENGTITDVQYRYVNLSQVDTATLLDEILKQKWTSKEANDWNNHKLIFSMPLGVKLTMQIQSPHSEKMQLNGVGVRIQPASAKLIWNVLGKYIIDEYIAEGP